MTQSQETVARDKDTTAFGAPTPDPELKRLEPLLGAWKTEANTLDGILGPHPVSDHLLQQQRAFHRGREPVSGQCRRGSADIRGPGPLPVPPRRGGRDQGRSRRHGLGLVVASGRARRVATVDDEQLHPIGLP
jgi:hypothetical protein